MRKPTMVRIIIADITAIFIFLGLFSRNLIIKKAVRPMAKVSAGK